MTHSALQSMQASAQAPGYLRFHPKPDNNVSFGDAISIGRDSRERHADYAVMFGDFGADIDPQRVCAVIEDHKDFVAVVELPNCPHRENAL